jgi:hypothetical protein
MSDHLKRVRAREILAGSQGAPAVGAARQMLIELRQTGTGRDCFGRITDIEAADRWYRTLGESEPTRDRGPTVSRKVSPGK